MLYIPWHMDHAEELQSNDAELLFEYLGLYSRFYASAEDGYFECSATEIEGGTRLKRFRQDRARELLKKQGWIDCRLSSGRSPTLKYKLLR